MIFASSMKSSSDMEPSLIIFMATSCWPCHFPYFTTPNWPVPRSLMKVRLRGSISHTPGENKRKRTGTFIHAASTLDRSFPISGDMLSQFLFSYKKRPTSLSHTVWSYEEQLLNLTRPGNREKQLLSLCQIWFFILTVWTWEFNQSSHLTLGTNCFPKYAVPQNASDYATLESSLECFFRIVHRWLSNCTHTHTHTDILNQSKVVNHKRILSVREYIFSYHSQVLLSMEAAPD